MSTLSRLEPSEATLNGQLIYQILMQLPKVNNVMYFQINNQTGGISLTPQGDAKRCLHGTLWTEHKRLRSISSSETFLSSLLLPIGSQELILWRILSTSWWSQWQTWEAWLNIPLVTVYLWILSWRRIFGNRQNLWRLKKTRLNLTPFKITYGSASQGMLTACPINTLTL